MSNKCKISGSISYAVIRVPNDKNKKKLWTDAAEIEL